MSSFPLGAGYRSGAEVQGFVEELKRERREINDTLRELIGRSDNESRQRITVLKSELLVIEANLERLEGLAKQFERHEKDKF